MAKRSAAFDLTLPSRRHGIAAYRWLHDSLCTEILQGRLRPGTRLPATRDLASQYGLARGTIIAAFEQLKSEGYLEGTMGSGTFVSRVLPEELLHVQQGNSAAPLRRRIRQPRLSDYGRRVRLFGGYGDHPIRAFRSNLPALDLFPAGVWARLTSRRLRNISRAQLMGCGPLGHPPLRQAIAEYLITSRGVRCTAEQVVIVSGAQEALDLASRLLLNFGDSVCVEDPGYPGATLAFQTVGAKIYKAGLDGEGIDVGELPARGVRLLYVTPGHQFPLGMTMSLARRLQLLNWARKSGALIFEDDYDSEYRYSGRPIPSLQGLDRSGSVLYAGSFSKVLFPALRLGYLVVPDNLLAPVGAMKSLTNRHAPMLEQLVLSDFIGEGHFGRHLRRMREVYAERLSILMEESRSSLDGLDMSEVQAGLQTVGWLKEGIDAERVAAAAKQRNVQVMPAKRYGRGKFAREGLILGFAAIDGKEIRRGCRELAAVLKRFGTGGGAHLAP